MRDDEVVSPTTEPTVPPPTRARRISLFIGLATVGAIGFGGGSALIPVTERELVRRRGLLRETQYRRHTIVANITPGALPVKLAAAAGITVGGWGLAVIAALVVALPGVLGTLGLLAGSEALGPGAVTLVSRASVGITAFIVVLLIGYIHKVHAHAGTRRLRFVGITAVAAVITGAGELLSLAGALVGAELHVTVPRLNAVQLIVAALLVIVAVSVIRPQAADLDLGRSQSSPPQDHGKTIKAAVAFAAMTVVGLIGFIATGGGEGLTAGFLLALSSVTSFGGGEAYIGVADGFFVASGLVDQTAFYTQLVPIANALPGPILVKVAAGMGYLLGADTGPATAWLLAGATALIVIGACSLVAVLVLGGYERLKDHPIMVNIGIYILPVICGLLVTVSATMFDVATTVAAEAGFAAQPVLIVLAVATMVLTWVHLRTRIPDLVLLAGCAAASLVILGL